VGFYNGCRAASNPNREGRYNLNQHLKERNNGYFILVQKELLLLCLHFPIFLAQRFSRV